MVISPVFGKQTGPQAWRIGLVLQHLKSRNWGKSASKNNSGLGRRPRRGSEPGSCRCCMGGKRESVKRERGEDIGNFHIFPGKEMWDHAVSPARELLKEKIAGKKKERKDEKSQSRMGSGRSKDCQHAKSKCWRENIIQGRKRMEIKNKHTCQHPKSKQLTKAGGDELAPFGKRGGTTVGICARDGRK